MALAFGFGHNCFHHRVVGSDYLTWSTMQCLEGAPSGYKIVNMGVIDVQKHSFSVRTYCLNGECLERALGHSRIDDYLVGIEVHYVVEKNVLPLFLNGASLWWT